jgi:predicted transcriptional regulator
MPTDALNIWAVAVFAIGGVLYLVIGVSRVAITRLERGDVDARFATIRKLAEALGVEPAVLMEPLH